MFIARQRLGKRIQAATNTEATIESLPLLCNGAVNTPSQQEKGCVFCVVRAKCYKKISKLAVTTKNGIDFSRRQPARVCAWKQRNWTKLAMQNNGKKGIRLCKEDFMCDLKWQWDCYKSVAWIRLLKAENPSTCVTVNCKVCRIATVLYLHVVPSCVNKL
jgi:hypothetical protein